MKPVCQSFKGYDYGLCFIYFTAWTNPGDMPIDCCIVWIRNHTGFFSNSSQAIKNATRVDRDLQMVE